MSAKLLALPSIVLLTLAVGCEAPDLPSLPVATPVAAEAPAEPAPTGEVGPNGTEVPPMEKPVTKTPRVFTSRDPIQGRRSRAAGGYLGAVGNANFYARHQMVINNVNHALALFNAEHGDWPKSHDEFMEKIIKFNNIELPRLDDPIEYIFVPEDGAKGLQIRLKPDFDGDVWPPGANPADATDDAEPEYEQPNQPNQPGDAGAEAPPTDRAIGVGGAGAAAGVAPLDLQQ